jgi:hypothetical protein
MEGDDHRAEQDDRGVIPSCRQLAQGLSHRGPLSLRFWPSLSGVESRVVSYGRAMRRWSDGLAVLLPVAVAAVVVTNVLLGFAARVGAPFDLEWMEGGQLVHAWRLAEGLPLFAPPSEDWVPFVYPPGYPAVVAALGEVFGVSLPLGRVVSIAGTIAAAAAAFHLVHHVGRSPLFALVAAATFLGTWPQAGAFYDIVRADGLFVGLLGGALALAFDGRRGTGLAAGLLLAAAIPVKHSALPFVLPVALAVASRRGAREGWIAVASALVPPALLALWLQVRSDGAFLNYIVDVPLTHPMIAGRVWPGLPRDLGAALPIASAVPAVWLVMRGVASGAAPPWIASFVPAFAGMLCAWWGTVVAPSGPPVPAFASGLVFFGVGASLATLLVSGGTAIGSRGARFETGGLTWAAVVGVALAVAAVMRAHNGGYLNVLAPLFWVMSVVFALVLARMWNAARRPSHRWAAALLATAQLGWAATQIDRPSLEPIAADRAAWERLVEAARQAEGAVWSPYAAWIPHDAGKRPSAHTIGFWDLGYDGTPFPEHDEIVREAIRERRWALVIGSSAFFPYDLSAGYRESEVFEEDRALCPKTGWKACADRLLVPKIGAPK